MQMNGIVCIVTGGSSGLGSAAVELLTSHGASVSIFDRSAPQRPGLAKHYTVDVTDEREVNLAIDDVVKTHGALHVCVSCAGIVTSGSLIDEDGVFPADRFRKTLDVNLVGTFIVMAAAAKRMAKNATNEEGERGVIINTASIAATDPSVSVAYAASKAGVAAMSLTAAHDLAEHGIRVNAIAPGYMDTPMFASLPRERVDQLVGNTVFPKRLGRPEEFARLVVHLIENTFINAALVRCDGGARGVAVSRSRP